MNSVWFLVENHEKIMWCGLIVLTLFHVNLKRNMLLWCTLARRPGRNWSEWSLKLIRWDFLSIWIMPMTWRYFLFTQCIFNQTNKRTCYKRVSLSYTDKRMVGLGVWRNEKCLAIFEKYENFRISYFDL